MEHGQVYVFYTNTLVKEFVSSMVYHNMRGMQKEAAQLKLVCVAGGIVFAHGRVLAEKTPLLRLCRDK